MSPILVLLFASMSTWALPQCQQAQERLRRDFATAVVRKAPAEMLATCRKGVELLPEDPSWQYNLACSLALCGGSEQESLDALERAIDFGFRNDEAIAKDADFASLTNTLRFAQLLEYARLLKKSPVTVGPFSRVPARGEYGRYLELGEQNVLWDFNSACFDALVDLKTTTNLQYVGDFYYNLDQRHSLLPKKNFPGITFLGLDHEGRKRQLDVNFPNLVLRDGTGRCLPVFGNCSRAFVNGPLWRSLPRALMTLESFRLKTMTKLYLSNQLWFFPSAGDTAPVGTNGDVYASITPLWMTTAGRSWSDQPYLAAALEAARAIPPETRAEIERRGLLAPTVFTLMRKSLKGVPDEAAYLTPRAHPSALPPRGLELPRLQAAAKALAVEAIPPLAVIGVVAEPPEHPSKVPELSYAGVFAWAYVLRSDDSPRTFTVKAAGAKEFAFVQTHGGGVKVRIDRLAEDTAKVTLDLAGLSPTNRVDITVVGRNPGTGWGAPSYISFSRLNPSAKYSDPALTPGAVFTDR